MTRRRLTQLVLLLCIIALPLSAAQRDLVVTVVPDDGQWALGEVDLHTGEVAVIGAIGFTPASLAFDASGRLFAVDPELDVLLTIDLDSGFGSVVGSLDVDLIAQTGLTFDRHDRLWMTGESTAGLALFELDPNNGATRVVGSITERAAGGLTAVGDTLYSLSDRLYRIDPGDGSTKPVFDADGSSAFVGIGMDADRFGRLWSLELCVLCMTPFDQIHFTSVQLSTGERHVVGQLAPQGSHGLAILPGTTRIGTPVSKDQPQVD